MATKTHRSKRKASGQPQRSVERKRVTAWSHLLSNKTYRIAAVLLVAALTLTVRLTNLSADPPQRASWSQDVMTDPPQYTAYARNKVVTGLLNPLNDENNLFFVNNVTTLLSYVVFAILGPSMATANLTAVLWNLLAIGFLVWAVGRSFGFMAGFGAAWFLAINHLILAYSRQPFLEVGANACLVVSFWGILASERQWWWVLVSGVAAGAGTFFGKVTSLHTSAFFVLGAGLIGWQAYRDQVWQRWARPIGYAMSMGIVGALWYVFVYRTAGPEVLSYLKEQSLNLYGAPVGLSSVSGFVKQWFSFGINNRLLSRAPAFTIAGFLGMCLMVMSYCRGRSFVGILKSFPPVMFLTIGWFWSVWAALSPFNYRPVRYQIVLFYPLAVAAGWFVARWTNQDKQFSVEAQSRRPWWVIPIVTIILISPLVHLLMAPLAALSPAQSNRFSYGFMALLVAGLIASAWWYFSNRRTARQSAAGPRIALELGVAILLLVSVVNQGRRVWYWLSHSSHSFAAANVDLAASLGPNAVVSGAWAPALTQNNDSLISLSHMFVAREPEGFFSKFPMTHVAVEDKADNPFFRDFPELAQRAERVTTYSIQHLRIAILRIADLIDNPVSRQYQLSPIERLKMNVRGMPLDSLCVYANSFVADSADTYTGWQYVGERWLQADNLDSALASFRRALVHFPDDFVLLAQTGDLSWQQYRTFGGPPQKEEALRYWRRALRLSPGHPQIVQRIQQAERS